MSDGIYSKILNIVKIISYFLNIVKFIFYLPIDNKADLWYNFKGFASVVKLADTQDFVCVTTVKLLFCVNFTYILQYL